MKRKIIKNIAAVSLVTIFLFTPGASCLANTGIQAGAEATVAAPVTTAEPLAATASATENAEATASTTATIDANVKAKVASKTEVVYAKLTAKGETSAVYVVNEFEVSEAGSIKDYGNYSAVINLTDTGALTQDEDIVSFVAGAGEFYYQGNMDRADLPWTIEISYTLDGVAISPEDLAGRSGELKIHIKTRQNKNADPIYYSNYMLQISIALDSEKCSNISAPDATIASAGQNTAITYTVMPEKDADFTVSAKVSDFEMDGIQVAGLPMSFNIDMSSTDDLISDFGKLADAISDLNSGVKKLVSGAKDLRDAAKKLSNSSNDIKMGLEQLKNNASTLIGSSSAINDALAQISQALNADFGDIDFSELQQLPDALSQLSGGLTQISGGLRMLVENFETAYAALDSAIDTIPSDTLTQQQLGELYTGTDPSLYGVLDTLTAYYAAGQTVKGTYGQVKGAFDAISTTIESLCGNIDTIAGTLDTIASNVSDSLTELGKIEQLEQLVGGINELADNYAAFHQGLTAYANGVGEIADGYSAFSNGLDAFSSGLNTYYNGIVKLYEGTTELNNETKDLPGEVESKIDDLVAQYRGDDFTPVSFTSSKNKEISLVQFVLKCSGVKKAEPTSTEEPETDNETFWDRLWNLFAG